jgi:hypothetical protein
MELGFSQGWFKDLGFPTNPRQGMVLQISQGWKIPGKVIQDCRVSGKWFKGKDTTQRSRVLRNRLNEIRFI